MRIVAFKGIEFQFAIYHLNWLGRKHFEYWCRIWFWWITIIRPHFKRKK